MDTIFEEDVLYEKYVTLIQALTELRFTGLDCFLQEQRKHRFSVSEKIVSLFYVYNDFDTCNNYFIDECGRTSVTSGDNSDSSKNCDWFIILKKKYNFFLEPLPIFCKLSGCMRLVETGETIRVVSDNYFV
jgi:hypothetical protein